jgi:hypothetical protein
MTELSSEIIPESQGENFGNGSNGQALTADMTEISKKLQHWVAKFMFPWIRC